MANNDVRVSCLIPVKTAQQVENVATAFDYSRGKTLHMLIELGLRSLNEDVENSSVTTDGAKNKYGAPGSLNLELRKLV